MLKQNLLISTLLIAVFFLASCGEDYKYEKAAENRDIKALEEYLGDYPAGKHIKEATELIEQLKFEKARETATEEAYKTFLKTYPDGKYSKEVKILWHPNVREYKEGNVSIMLLEKKQKYNFGTYSIKPTQRGHTLYYIKLRGLKLKEKLTPTQVVVGDKEYGLVDQMWQVEVGKGGTLELMDHLYFFSIPEKSTPDKLKLGEMEFDLTKLELGKNYKEIPSGSPSKEHKKEERPKKTE